MKNLMHIVRLGAILLFPMALLAQNPQIKRILDQAKLKYAVDKDGDFKMTFDVGEGRSQLVFVMSKMEKLGDEPIVEIWSPAYKSTDISRETLLLVAADGTRRKVGGWEVHAAGDYIYAVFKAKVPLSSLTPTFVQAVCAGVASVADEVEKKTLGSDDL